jgi:hypothetical protein
MVCGFSIGLDQRPEDLLDRARTAVAGAGGSLDGDAHGGRLRVPTPLGPIEGTYTVDGSEVRFDISRKPAFVSCSKIEAKGPRNNDFAGQRAQMRPPSKARGGRNLPGFNRRATPLGGMQLPSNPEVILARSRSSGN